MKTESSIKSFIRIAQFLTVPRVPPQVSYRLRFRFDDVKNKIDLKTPIIEA